MARQAEQLEFIALDSGLSHPKALELAETLAPMLPIDLFQRPMFALSAATSVCSFSVQGLAMVALLLTPERKFVRATDFRTSLRQMLAHLRNPRLLATYAVGFGGFVAFSVYLPTYLINAFALTPGDAALRTAGFVVLAVAMRPVGGWLSDKYDPLSVMVVCFVAAGVLAGVAALELPLVPIGTGAFLGLGAALGASAGATFALVAILAPPTKVGAVTGIVGAAGGLGGFVPPLVMGVVFSAVGDYSLGLALLAVVCLSTAVYTRGPVRHFARAA